MASVAELLNSAQDSAAAAERCAGTLWKHTLQDPDATHESLRKCAEYLVTIGQKSTYVERCIRFFGMFASKTPADNEMAAAVMEELLQQLAGHLSAVDKVVRYRSAQLLQHMLSALPDSLLLEDSVAEQLRSSLRERLQDKLPAVRAEACRAISHLVSEDGEGQAVVEAMMGLLETDKSKDVRIAVVQSLPLNTDTLPVLLERMRDVNPLVRKALVQRLKGLSIKLLSIKQRAEVIQQVLQDRDAAVADAAAKLLAHWLVQDCNGDPLALLQLLDVETYTEAAARALESLINSGSIYGPSSSTEAAGSQHGVTAYVEAATKGAARPGGGLLALRVLAEQQQDGQLLEAHEALMWRCLCEWLRSDAISKGLAAAATGGARAAMQAAVAAERHEVLERALPESADELMQLVMRHAAAGPAARFAAAQLLMIASTCVEWTDAASRAMALPYLQQLIGLDPTAEAEQQDGMDEDDGSCSSNGGVGDDAGLQLAGNGGDGMFEAAVVQLVLAVQGAAGPGFTVAMLDGIAPLAAAAGLLPKPGSEDREAAAVTVCVADPSQVLQCLAYIRLLLQRLPSARPVQDEGSTLSFSSLWELLLLLALKQDQPDIRAKAVECIGLYALAGASNPALLSSAVQLLGPLLVAGSCNATKQAAVKGLVDMALLFGPAAVDAVLKGPAAVAGAVGADGEAGDGDAGATAAEVCSGLSKGLLELLLEQSEALLAEAQAPSAAKAKKGRAASASAKGEPSPLPASTAELLAAVAESLGKLLLHQRVWLRRYQHYVPPAALPASSVSAAAAETDEAAADAEEADMSTPGPASQAAAAEAKLSNSSSSGGSSVSFPPDSRQQQALLLRRALALLLQMQFHPATEAALQLRQCLSVFFDVFTAAAGEFRLQLVAACLPAARQALHITCKKNPAALLVKYVLQLLQATHGNEQHQQQQAATAGASSLSGCVSYEVLAMQLLGEVELLAPITVGSGVQPAKYKPYLSAVLKVVCELPLSPTHEDWPAVQLMAGRLSTSISDATLKKDVASLQLLLQRLLEEAGGEKQQLQPEQLDKLIEQVQAMSLEQLAPLPGAAGAAVAAASGGSVPVTPAPRTTRKAARGGAATASRATGMRAAPATATRRTGRLSVAAAAASSSSEGDSDSSSDSSDADGDSSGGSDSDDSVGEQDGAAAASAAAGSGKAAAAAARSSARRSSVRQPLGPSTIVNSQQ